MNDAATFSRTGLKPWVLIALLYACAPLAAGATPYVNQNVEITVLSTNLAELHGRGEWGWSALIKSDGRCVLFDTGNHPDTVLANAEVLGVDLSCITDVVLSHHHADHSGGVLSIYAAIGGEKDRFARVHVAQGYFLERPRDDGSEGNIMIAARKELETKGVKFNIYDAATEILPGMWATGPIERVHPEKNYPTFFNVKTDAGIEVDWIPESQGLAILTEEGFVVVLGCGHAGVVNTLTHVQNVIDRKPIAAVMGGFHLFNANQETLDWVGERLAEIAPKHVMGAHCTGVQPLYEIRKGANMNRKHAVIGSVGATYKSGEGFTPGMLAR